MSSDRNAGDLADAAAVHAAREQLVSAIGPLAVRPLDQQAAEQMRAALERVDSPQVRAAVRRLTRDDDHRPFLRVVTSSSHRGPGLGGEAPSASPSDPRQPTGTGDRS